MSDLKRGLKMNKFLKGLSLWLIIILVVMLFARLMRPQEYKEIDYSEFKSYLRSGRVMEALISEAVIKGKFTNEQGEIVKFKTVPVEDPKLVEELEAYGVKYKGEVKKNWLSVVLFNFGPILLFIFIWFMLIRSMQAGGKQAMSFGRSRAKLTDQSKQRVTFNDVAGVDEAKEELQEIIAFLMDPKKFQKLGGKIPKGVLLYGAPGSGKTLLAKAVAGEARVPFFSASGSEFVEMFVGVGASRVRDLFNQGKKSAPCLTGDTRIVLSDGRQLTIGDMYNKNMIGTSVPAMTEEFKVGEAKVLKITRKQVNLVYKIDTVHTRIEATGNHLFPVLKGGRLEWIRADELQDGDYLAAPRKIKVSSAQFECIDFLPSQTRLYLEDPRGKRRARFVRVKDVKKNELNFQEIKAFTIGRGGWTDSTIFKMPEYLNEELTYLTGLIFSDGHIGNRHLRFYNTNEHLHKLLTKIVEKNFAYKTQEYRYSNCWTTDINNSLIRQLVRNIQNNILRLPEKLIAAWLSGVFDGDGCVSGEGNDPKATISAWNEASNRLIRDALHRIGIVPYLPRHFTGNVEITGKKSLSLFLERVFPQHPEKLKRLQNLNLSGLSFSRLDVVPLTTPHCLSKGILQVIPLPAFLFGVPASLWKPTLPLHRLSPNVLRLGNSIAVWDTNVKEKQRLISPLLKQEALQHYLVSRYERGVGAPASTIIQDIVDEIDQWRQKAGKSITEELVSLKQLVFGEVVWSRVTKIEKINKEVNVYDLCLDRYHNFVANNIFVHNCLLFIDELDAVGRHRFAGIGGGHDEREQTLNQLLVEMDGFDTKEGVILIAATNRPDVLDPALLRPGRFDRHIMVPNPDLKGREEILKVHTRHIKLALDVDLKVIARRTPGFVGSDIANLVNEAALLAAREDKTAVGMKEVEEAIDRVIAGPQRKSRMISEREKKIIAYHEAGHTLVAKLIPGTDPIHKVSIIPRGPALGYTLQLPLEDKYLSTKTEIIDKMTVFLGGRAAEELTFNELTTGAENDLHQATEIAHKMICEYGMSDKLGPLTLRKKETEIFLGRDFTKEKAYSEKTAQMIDEEVKKIVEDCRDRAKELLRKNKAKLARLAKALIEKEILVGEEVEEILKHGEEVSGKEKKNRTQDKTKKSGE